MSDKTMNYRLNVPGKSDFVDIDEISYNFTEIDKILQRHETTLGTITQIDCGGFEDEDNIAIHNETETAHAYMIVDGNATEATTQSTLEEHMTSMTAHQNINIDGNSN